MTLTSDTDTNIEDCIQSDRLKKFWSFMKNFRKDSTGVACLRGNGILKTANKDKVDIFNRQFESVYTREQVGDPHRKDKPLSRYRIPGIYSLTLMGSKNYLTVLTPINPGNLKCPRPPPDYKLLVHYDICYANI